MRSIFLFILVLHALIHLLGFVKAFKLVDVPQLSGTISRRVGLLWLLATVLYLTTAALLLFGKESWWIAGIPACILSQTLIFIAWNDARFGTIANLIVLIPLVVTGAGALPGSYHMRYKAEVQKGLSRYTSQSLVTEEDLRHLPPPVQRYLRYTGSVGRPRIHNFHAVYTGHFKRSVESGWMDFRSEQYNFYDDPTRVFFIQSSVAGIPFDGLHLYAGRRATMQIKVASLFEVVDAKGDTMTRGETVTLFNDMCVMAPATLIDSSIVWEPIDSLTVKGTFTNKGISVSALLSFNERGELIDFSSDDRFMSADGITYANYRWTTPMKNYREIDGRRLATEAELVWHMPQGEFTYGTFILADIRYNCETIN